MVIGKVVTSKKSQRPLVIVELNDDGLEKFCDLAIAARKEGKPLFINTSESGKAWVMDAEMAAKAVKA